MLSASSTMSINGLSVTLSVQLGRSFLRQQAGNSVAALSDEELEDLLHRCLQGMPQALLQAHDSVSQGLLSASVGILAGKGPRSGEPPPK